MSDESILTGPARRFGERNPACPDARVIEGVTTGGRPCRIVDNTACLTPAEVKTVLDDLVRARRGGGLSAAGADRITIGSPHFGQVQIRETLYRLLVFPYEARIEPF